MRNVQLIGKFRKVFDWKNNIETDLEICIDVEYNITLKDYLNEVQNNIDEDRFNVYCIELSHEYYNNISWLNNCNEVPFIIEKENNIVRWSVNYEKVKLIDLLNTLKIKDSIYLDIIPKGIGGVSFCETIKKIWEIFINSIGSIIFTVDAINSFKFIKDKLIKKKANPVSFITYIYNKDKWNLNELCESVSLDKENLRNILKGLGYKWNKKELLYEKTEESNIIYKKITEIEYNKYSNK